MLRAQLHSFDHSPFSAVSLHKYCGLIFFAKPLTTECSAAILRLKTKFSYLIAKCDWVFSLISSPGYTVLFPRVTSRGLKWENKTYKLKTCPLMLFKEVSLLLLSTNYYAFLTSSCQLFCTWIVFLFADPRSFMINDAVLLRSRDLGEHFECKY